MKQKIIFICLFATVLFPGLLQAGGQSKVDSIYGFSKARVVEQMELENRIREIVDPLQNKRILHALSTRVNFAGSPGDRKNAEFFRDYLNSLGYKTKIYSYFVYLPYPVRSQIFIKGQRPLTLVPGEKGVKEDTDSTKARLTPFNAYSPSGKVTAAVVYANYASPDDFDVLERLGVEIKGKIIIARYGKLFRGSKAFEAEKRGASGIIFYSDPINDGYFQGDVYPEGPMRPGDAIQRGSILYMFNTPGDPLTPMEPALQFAGRITPEEAGLPGIPALPIGYDHAAEILKRMKGQDVPQQWQGGLPFRYHIDSSDLEITIDVKVEYKIREIWDVIGILEGRENPDQWVMVGCHRDAWVYGTADPHSGNAVMLEAARAIAEASRQGGGLKRSVVVCSWDAEEFGVIGSIEWVEEMRDTLKEKAVVYMNADGIVSGPSFGASALPTLRPALQEVLNDVSNHDNKPFFRAWQEMDRGNRALLEMYSFGSMGGGGSDHTGFIHHVGVPCMSAGSWGAGGVHHSTYDTIHWMESFGDPEYRYHSSMSRLMATTLSRFANADVVPLAPSQYSEELKKFHESLVKEIPDRLLEKLSNMEALYEAIAVEGKEFEAKLHRALEAGELTREQSQAIDIALMALEKSFTSPDGVPGRPWNKNLLYAPNQENGYGMITFPGLIATHSDENKFILEVKRFEKCLQNYIDVIYRASKALN